MRDWNPVYIILLGGILLAAGWFLPFFMILHILPSTYFFNFFAFIAQFLGITFGLIGMAFYVGRHKKKP